MPHNAEPNSSEKRRPIEDAAKGLILRASFHAQLTPADRRSLESIARNDFIIAVYCYQRGRSNAAILWSHSPCTDEAYTQSMSTGAQRFNFGIYTLRPTTEADMANAVKWTAADTDHAERTRPEFWLEWTVHRESYVLEDELGPIFFFKVHRLSLKAVELHIQFPPADTQHERIRIQQALVHGFQWLEGMLKAAHIEEVSFDSTSTRLVQFAEKRLGFRRKGNRLHKSIAA